MFRLLNPVSEGTYIQLVRSLFRTLVPTLIIGIAFVGVGRLVTNQTPDRLLSALSVLGTVAVISRLVILLLYRGEAADPALSLKRARRLERIFAAGYLSFALIFGLFGARAFYVAMPDTHVLIVGLVIGYAAGVATGVAYRPLISVAAMCLGVIPTLLMSLASSNTMYQALGALLAILLIGGLQSMRSHYRFASAGMTMTQLFADMAKRDVLTGLPNRFGLGERFNNVTLLGRNSGELAVHCLDLDRFKPVNDRYGHPVGDELLKAVAERLSRALRGEDFAARVGGDEFVVVQSGISDHSEAELLARRIIRVVSEPYAIGDLKLTIDVSIGYALGADRGHALDRLIAAADEALLRAKASGGGCASAGDHPDHSLRRAG